MGEKITFDKKNYRKHSVAHKKKIKKSLQECGAGRSVLVDKDGCLIAGNGVYEQAEKLGIKTRIVETDGSELVVVKRTDLATDDEKRKQLALADNATSDKVEWDFDAIGEDFEVEDLKEWDIEFNVQTEEKEVVEDDFDDGKDEVNTICTEGDIWQLGEHRLMCGDSTKGEDVARLMNGEKADIWITDPPYNVDYTGGTREKLYIKNDKMKSNEFRELLSNAFFLAHETLNDGCPFYVWYSTREHINFESALKQVGLSVRQVLIWAKNKFTLGRSDYQHQYEPCLYGWKDGCAHVWYNDRKQGDVLTFSKPNRNAEHPTMKPLELFGYLITNSSKKGAVIYDNFGGSGTTLIAAEQLGRKCFMMELDPHYCDVIIARWEKLTGKKANKIN